MDDVSVKITGLRELSRAFKAIDAELPKEMKARFLTVAGHVAGVAQQRMPWLSGRAVRSVKPRATAKGASVVGGGQAAPYFAWLDFGGSVGRGHKDRTGGSGAIKRPWEGLPKSPAGRYLYPAISEAKPETERAVNEAVDAVAKSAGFETKGGF